ncbi:MAG: Mu-like prophage major head subunit gpT family protein [Gemmatimonadaceae bacterium]|nr:Mu-like prophage major head subunit gpT family protein [Gemmatimonadaceae bacterium]
MAMVSDHWSELVEPRLRRAFFLGFGQEDRRQSMIPQLYNVQTSNMADEKVLVIGGVGSSGWNFEDSGRVQYDEASKGYEETFTHHEFAKGIIIERKLIDDNRIARAVAAVEMLGDAAFKLREKAGANVFINAFSSATTETLDDYGTDATGSDAVALCSAAHPRHPGDTGTTDTNEGTLALNVANVSTTRQLMAALVDLNGDLLNIMPDELLVPPELEDTALTIVRSAQDPSSANNAINPQAGRFTVKVWHYLTDADSWFMMDSARRRQSLHWFERNPLEFAREQDFDTLQAKFRAYTRYSLGWSDWRFVYGQNAS